MKKLTSIARKLRKEQTKTEKHLWKILRFRNTGVKFRRQAVIGRYIVDFVSFERKLIIEVDGGQHNESKNDVVRDQWLRSQGFTVLRFWNNEVLENLEGVYEEIEKFLKLPPP